MIKFINNNKGKTVIVIVIIFIFIFTMIGILYLRSLSRNIEINIKDVTVADLQRGRKDGLKDYFNGSYTEWGVSSEENKNIINNPKEYMMISYELNITNNTKYIKLFADHLTPTWGDEIQNIMVGYFDIYRYREAPAFYKPDGKICKRSINIIVKCNGKTDEEIIELAKKSSFLFTGHGYWFDTEFDQNPHTEQYSIDVKSLN